MTSAAVEYCAMCGGIVGHVRTVIGGKPYHAYGCSHDARDHRIAELESALRPFAAAYYNDNGDVEISVGHLQIADWMRASKILQKPESR